MSDLKNTDATVSKYSVISGNVWNLFKKYLPTDADLITFPDDVHALDEAYKGTPEYKFMQELLKAYFNELNRIKGEQYGKTEKS